MPFGEIANTFKDFFNIIFGRMPKRSVTFLKRRGDFVITSIMLRRQPIMRIIDKVFNVLSLGKWDELKTKYGYDQMYHLSMIITLSNDERFIVEKNEVINIGGNVTPDQSDVEYFPIELKGKRITVNQLVENTIKSVGEDRFLNYDAFTTNCQRFIMDILSANGLLTPAAEKWILQPVDQLVKELPEYVDKTAKVITDIGGYGSRIKEAIGLKKGGRVQKQRKFGGRR